MTKRTLTVTFLGVLIIASIALFVQALGFVPKAINTRTPGARFFPLVTLSTIIALSTALVVQKLRRNRQKSQADDERIDLTKAQLVRIGLVAVTSFAGFALWDVVGFLPMAFFLVAGISIIVKIRSVWAYGIMAVAVTGLYFAFSALNIPLD